MHGRVNFISGGQCSATFVDNDGTRYSNNIAMKIDDSTYVFGKNAGGYLKMVAVDSSGKKTKIRYIGPYGKAPEVVTKERWESGRDINNVDYYNVEDVSMGCIGM